MMLLNNILLVIAVALMSSAKFARRLELMTVGRLVHGVNAGRLGTHIGKMLW